MPRLETCVKRKSVHEFFLSFIVRVIGVFFNSIIEMSYDCFVLIDRIKTGKGCRIGHGVIYIMFLLRALLHSDNFIVCTILNIS